MPASSEQKKRRDIKEKSHHGQLPADVPHRHSSREEDAGQPGANVAQLRRREPEDETGHGVLTLL